MCSVTGMVVVGFTWSPSVDLAVNGPSDNSQSDIPATGSVKALKAHWSPSKSSTISTPPALKTSTISTPPALKSCTSNSPPTAVSAANQINSSVLNEIENSLTDVS
jgi:hypothetical protein